LEEETSALKKDCSSSRSLTLIMKTAHNLSYLFNKELIKNLIKYNHKTNNYLASNHNSLNIHCTTKAKIHPKDLGKITLHRRIQFSAGFTIVLRCAYGQGPVGQGDGAFFAMDFCLCGEYLI
jgi:hypothetical protein